MIDITQTLNHLAEITMKNRPEALRMMQDEEYRKTKIQEYRNDIARQIREARKKGNPR